MNAANLQQRISELWKEAENLAVLLDAALTSLRVRGAPPTHAVRQASADLEDRLTELSAELKRTLPGISSIVDVAGLTPVAERLQQVERESRQVVRERLSRLVTVSSVDGDVVGLEIVRKSAQELLELSERSWGSELGAFELGAHPLSWLHRLVDAGGSSSLPEREQDEAEDTIEDAFGREVRRAAQRGKLLWSSDHETTPIDQQTPEASTKSFGLPLNSGTPLACTPDSSHAGRMLTGNRGLKLSLLAEGMKPKPPGEAFRVNLTKDDADLEQITLGIRDIAATEPSAPSSAAPAAIGDQHSDINERAITSPISNQVEGLAENGAEGSSEESEESCAPDAGGPTVPELRKSESVANDLTTNPGTQAKSLPDASLLWLLIGDGRLSAAFHLASRLPDYVPSEVYAPPPWLLGAVALAPHLRDSDGGIAEKMTEFLGEYDEATLFSGSDTREAKSYNHAMRLLIGAAAVRPAVFVLASNAPQILQSLKWKGRTNCLYVLSQQICELAHHSIRFDDDALAAILNEEKWHADLAAVRELAREKHDRGLNRRLTLAYQMATSVISHWHSGDRASSRGGCLSRILTPVIENDVSRLIQVQQLVRSHRQRHSGNRLVADRQIVEQLIEEAQRSISARRRDPIVADARARLQEWFQECLDIAVRWIRLQDARPHNVSRDSIRLRHQVLREALQAVPHVKEELAAFALQETKSVSASAQLLVSALDGLRLKFDGSGSQSSKPEILVADALDSIFLEHPGFGVKTAEGNRLVPSIGEEEALQLLRAIVSSPAPDLQCRMQAFVDAQDYEGLQLLEEASSRLESANTTASTKLPASQVSDHFDQDCEEIKIKIRNARQQLEGAVLDGVVEERTRLEWISKLDSLQDSVGRRLLRRFAPAVMELDAIQGELTRRRQEGCQRLRKEVAALGLAPDDLRLARIEKVLAEGDLVTCEDYIERIRRHDELPENADPHLHFPEYYEGLQDLARFMEDCSNNFEREMRPRLSGKSSEQLPRVLSGLDSISQRQRHEGIRQLQAWFTIKQSRTASQDNLTEVLTYFGLTVRSVKFVPQASKGIGQWYSAETETPLLTQSTPFAAYGSQSEGRYRLLCLFEFPVSAERIVEAVGETRQRGPVIVLHFGRLTRQSRDRLAVLCRKERRTFLVVDDLMTIYLLKHRDAPFTTLLQLATPFTLLEPYGDMAGELPREMFFGRSGEQSALTRPDGTCLVYGGRQLGKTALLRAIERRFHSPEEGRIAIFVDLKVNDIGTDREPADLWEVLTARLRELPEGKAPMPQANAMRDGFISAVIGWLRAVPDRRLLLLLDEADRFLSADAKSEFRECEALQRLMQEARRQFKVVLAGLHNVYRTTRNINNPLAQLGSPVCIGPLLNKGEARDARAMVDSPLALAGYQFDSPDLITRILSQTNYYPSLIQLYCKELLEHMVRRTKGASDTLPYRITSRDLDEVYTNHLHARIVDKFKITLDLDPRYRVIAYSIAYDVAYRNPDLMTQGFAYNELLDAAMAWWREGFRDSASRDAFSALLDEMEGLGVLRQFDREGQKRYSLRSHNVLRLLGTREEVESELLADLKRPQEFDASTFRRMYSQGTRRDHADALRLHPLTAQQEHELRGTSDGVVIVTGCEASGLPELPDFLRHSTRQIRYVDIRPTSGSVSSFRNLLAEQAERIRRHSGGADREEGSLILAISQDFPWNHSWLTEALHWLKSRRARQIARVVFYASPERLREITSKRLGFDDNSLVTTICLRPWNQSGLAPWLDAEKAPWPGALSRRADDVLRISGGWPTLLYRLRDIAKVSGPSDCETLLRDWEAEMERPEIAYQILCRDFGLTKQDQVWLRSLSEFSGEAEMTAALLAELLEIDASVLRLAFGRLTHLYLVLPDQRHDVWLADSVVARLLNAASSITSTAE